MQIKDLQVELIKFIPDIIAEKLTKKVQPIQQPFSEEYYTAFLFLDIVEFSSITEKIVKNFNSGLEIVSNILSNYLERLIRIITLSGGDIVKFAGDALFVIWKLEKNQFEGKLLAEKVYIASLCALEIQKKLFEFHVGHGIKLSVRIGVSAGKINAMHVGGAFERWEFVITGNALTSAANAQKLAEKGKVVISKKAWKLLLKYSYGYIKNKKIYLYSVSEDLKDKYLDQKESRVYKNFKILSENINILKSYIPRAIIIRIEEGYDSWHIDFLPVTTVFVKIGSNSMENLSKIDKVQEMMQIVQNAIYTYEGSINRFGVDDKGAIVFSVFGMPPLIHDDDPQRAMFSAKFLVELLNQKGYNAKIGITTGVAFCGTIGSEIRSEYTLHSPHVNFAARLMQISDGIVCDFTTYSFVKDNFKFIAMPPRLFKGKTEPIVYYKLEE